MRYIAVLTLLLMSAGCGKVLMKPDMSRVEGESLSYQEGYEQGCMSGYVAGGYNLGSFERDTQRAQDDEEYRLGWKKGYKVCKDEFRQMCREGGLFSSASLHCGDVRQQVPDELEET